MESSIISVRSKSFGSVASYKILVSSGAFCNFPSKSEMGFCRVASFFPAMAKHSDLCH